MNYSIVKVQPAMERETASLFKKRTYGSLSLGGSYGTAKRGDLSLLRLGSGFGRTARSDARLDDGILPYRFDQIPNFHSKDKYGLLRTFDPLSSEDFQAEKNSRSKISVENAMKQFPSEELNQDD